MWSRFSPGRRIATINCCPSTTFASSIRSLDLTFHSFCQYLTPRSFSTISSICAVSFLSISHNNFLRYPYPISIRIYQHVYLDNFCIWCDFGMGPYCSGDSSCLSSRCTSVRSPYSADKVHTLIIVNRVQTNPSDIKSLCGSLAESMKGNITEMCGGDAETEAKKAYADTCLSSAAVTISA
jgi:hypothetical protein